MSASTHPSAFTTHDKHGSNVDAPAAIDARTAPYAALVLRVALGAVFVAHAMMKVVVFSLPGTAEFFVTAGFPAWTAYLVFALELLGGLALVAGAYTRWAALALVPVMLGALSVHWPNGWMFAANGGGWEYVAFLIAALLAQAALGDGPWAILAGARRRSPATKHSGNS